MKTPVRVCVCFNVAVDRLVNPFVTRGQKGKNDVSEFCWSRQQRSHARPFCSMRLRGHRRREKRDRSGRGLFVVRSTLIENPGVSALNSGSGKGKIKVRWCACRPVPSRLNRSNINVRRPKDAPRKVLASRASPKDAYGPTDDDMAGRRPLRRNSSELSVTQNLQLQGPWSFLLPAPFLVAGALFWGKVGIQPATRTFGIAPLSWSTAFDFRVKSWAQTAA